MLCNEPEIPVEETTLPEAAQCCYRKAETPAAATETIQRWQENSVGKCGAKTLQQQLLLQQQNYTHVPKNENKEDSKTPTFQPAVRCTKRKAVFSKATKQQPDSGFKQ